MASKKWVSLEGALTSAQKAKLVGRRVMVYGLGRSGLAAVKLLREIPCELALANAGAVEDWWPRELVAKEQCFREEEAPFERSELIILSPGIAREHPLLREALTRGVEIIGEVELASWFWQAPIVSLTGTNGKTTTVTLLGELFKGQSLRPFVGGNIGIPFCEAILADTDEGQFDLAVLELSSFQLESSPSLHSLVSGILNITFSHGERYEDLASYTRAKLNIYQNSTSADALVSASNAHFLPPAQELEVAHYEIPTSGAHLYSFLERAGIERQDILVPGVHNLFNIAFALKMVELFFERSYGRTPDRAGLRKTLAHFRGVAHRLERVSTRAGPAVYNDSKSTNWESTKVAVRAMNNEERPLILIVGGQKRGRGDEITPHLEELKPLVDEFYLLGESAQLHARECAAAGVSYRECKNLEEVVRELAGAKGQGSVLFSPAAPSFDQFKDYVDRGNQFKNLIGRIL